MFRHRSFFVHKQKRLKPNKTVKKNETVPDRNEFWWEWSFKRKRISKRGKINYAMRQMPIKRNKPEVRYHGYTFLPMET